MIKSLSNDRFTHFYYVAISIVVLMVVQVFLYLDNHQVHKQMMILAKEGDDKSQKIIALEKANVELSSRSNNKVECVKPSLVVKEVSRSKRHK